MQEHSHVQYGVSGPHGTDAPSIKHKHADIICAWVCGAPVQGQSPSTGEWVDVPAAHLLGQGSNYLEPSPIHPDYDWWPNWRIAPR
jgi:hypothetical protein